MIKFSDWMEFMAVLCWCLLVLILTTGCSSVNHMDPLEISAKFPPKEKSNYLEKPDSSPKFRTKSTLPWMKELIEIANCTIHLPDLRKDLLLVKRFTHTTMSPEQVSAAVLGFKSSGVRTYRTKNPMSKAIATTYASDRENLYLNTRKNPRPLPSMVNTLCHEASHLNGFSHGDNNPKGKELSVPYYLGSLCQKYANLCIK
jgi:hypothetical protein